MPPPDTISPRTPHIQADQHQLTQVFTNLVINACEAMDGHGRITITTSPARIEDGLEGREAVRIEVTDSGPGMTRDVAEHVFAPFFTTKPVGRGTGLGPMPMKLLTDFPMKYKYRQV